MGEIVIYVASYINNGWLVMEYNKLGILFKFIENSIETSRNNLLQGTDITMQLQSLLQRVLKNLKDE
jgi:hypothetical protein